MRHPDQKLAKQRVAFGRLAPEMLGIGGNGFDLKHLHAALDTPDHGIWLVAAEIMLEALAQQRSNRRQVFPDIFARAVGSFLLLDLGQISLMFEKLRGHVLDRCDVIDQARRRRAARHPAHRGFVELRLSEREAAIFLDRLDPQRPIAADARQDDADRAVLLILRKRSEKRVDGAAIFARRRRHGDPQRIAFQCQRGIRRDDMNLVGRERGPILRLHDAP